MIRELSKKLSTLEKFLGDVIAAAEFRRGTFEPSLKILKCNRELKVVQLASPTEKILVKLVTPRKKIRAALGVRVQSEKKIWRIFTAEEVYNFVEEVGDKNFFHRFSPPIVPGLLILETVLNCPEFSSSNVVQVRFKSFVTAGESLTLNKKDEKIFEIQSAGRLKAVISAE